MLPFLTYDDYINELCMHDEWARFLDPKFLLATKAANLWIETFKNVSKLYKQSGLLYL